ncbi:hypothetical protein EC968_002365 [Mortierella alpina]|nr:hypothetical protein EC968_002365 [Mortierella alpina]
MLDHIASNGADLHEPREMKVAALLAFAFVATAVQANEKVTVNYCRDDGACDNVYVEPFQCKDLEFPGYLSSFQNTADCELFGFSSCRERSFPLKRGSHDINELRGKIVASIKCSKPGFPRNLAPAVQAAEVTVAYTYERSTEQYRASVEPFECKDFVHPGVLQTFQNTADCRLYENQGCWGRNFLLKRGSHDIHELAGKLVASMKCSDPGLPRNPAPAVQAADVMVAYTYEGSTVRHDASVKPSECKDLVHAGLLETFQNTADCVLFEYQDCEGRSILLKRGSHDTRELAGEWVASIKCSDPGLPRNPAPAVQNPAVTIYYCTELHGCHNMFVPPQFCAYLDQPGDITSIQTTADCELFPYPNCGGPSVRVQRGSSELQPPHFAGTIRCSDPGSLRNQLPMRRH